MRDTISRFLTYFSFLVSFGLFIITFVAAVLGKIEFIMHGCSLLAYPLAGALIGWLALAFAKNEKSILLAKKARNAGLMFAAMFFMLFFVQTPEFVNHEKKLGNSQARSARRHIEIAE